MPREAAAQDVEAGLNYVAPGAEPFVYRASHRGEGQSRSEGAVARHVVPIADARACDGGFGLDSTGFRLVAHRTAATDFHDDAQIAQVYEPEVAELVREALGARRVVPFDHTLRSDSDAIRRDRQIRDHVEMVHNDYTERSARRRVSDLMPESEAESLLGGRFAIVNAWRSIGGPAITTPLALCDARTIADGDLIAVERRAKDRIGELQQATYNPAHRWFWFPAMDIGEVVLFKTFDSAADGRARLSLHTAFANPEAPTDAPPRQSIETRHFVFF